jgi:divalent metal cation (Fe/Co/Zn/Cd) transporter
VSHRAGGGTAAGAALAAASAGTLAVLALVKLRIATRLGSEPLRSDSHLSATGALLAIVTLGGVVLHHITWLDGASTLAIAIAALASGLAGWPRMDGESTPR